MALSAASTGITWRPVANWTSSIASTTVGSERASVSVFPTFRTGKTWYFWTISLRTSRRMSGSTSTRPRLITGIPYFRLRKSSSSSSPMNPRRVRTVARRSPDRRWSATALEAWSWVSRFSLTSSSSRRGFTAGPSFRRSRSRSRLRRRSQRLVHELDETIESGAFLEKGDRLVMGDLLGEGVSNEAGDENHGQVTVGSTHGIQYHQSVHVGHHDVDHRQIEGGFLEL